MKILLVSNGFQPNYEKAFANGLAANGIDVVLVGSDRTLVAELVPGVKAINLRGSQNPCRSLWAKAVNILRYAIALIRCIQVDRHDRVVCGEADSNEPCGYQGKERLEVRL